jgi:hypothetical protein
MTTTTVRPVEDAATPESQNLAKLRAMLDDPALIGFRWEIEDAIARLMRGKKA